MARKYPIYYEKKGELGLKGWFKFGNAIYKKRDNIGQKIPNLLWKKERTRAQGMVQIPSVRDEQDKPKSKMRLLPPAFQCYFSTSSK